MIKMEIKNAVLRSARMPKWLNIKNLNFVIISLMGMALLPTLIAPSLLTPPIALFTRGFAIRAKLNCECAYLLHQHESSQYCGECRESLHNALDDPRGRRHQNRVDK